MIEYLKLEIIKDEKQMVDTIFDTSDLLQKDDSTCDKSDLMQMIDIAWDTSDLIQKTDVTCDTNDIVQLVNADTTNDMIEDSFTSHDEELFTSFKEGSKEGKESKSINKFTKEKCHELMKEHPVQIDLSKPIIRPWDEILNNKHRKGLGYEKEITFYIVDYSKLV